MASQGKPTTRRYSAELKARAVRMVRALREEIGEQHGSVKRVADQLDVGVESLRTWVRGDEVDNGEAAGTASTSQCDIPDLDAVVSAVRRVLSPAGWFVLTVPHPCFETPHATWCRTTEDIPAQVISAYYDEVFWRSSDLLGVRRVGNYHRTVSTYLNGLIRGGLVIDRVTEPMASTEMVALQPGRTQVPLLLVVRALRLPRPARAAIGGRPGG